MRTLGLTILLSLSVVLAGGAGGVEERKPTDEPLPEGEEIFQRLSEPVEKNRESTLSGMKQDASFRFYLYVFLLFLSLVCAGLLGYLSHAAGEPVGVWAFAGFVGGPVGLVFWFVFQAWQRSKIERQVAEAEEEAANPSSTAASRVDIAVQLAQAVPAALPQGTPEDIHEQYRQLVLGRLNDPEARSIGANDGGLAFLRALFSGKYGVAASATLANAEQGSEAGARGLKEFLARPRPAQMTRPDEVYFASACLPLLLRYKDWRLLQKFLYENPGCSLGEFVSAREKK